MNSTTVDRVNLRARLALLLSMFLTIMSAVTARAQFEQLVLYDDFTAPKISPAKWMGGEGRDDLGLEAKRLISNGQLLLNSRSIGSTVASSGVGTNVLYLSYAGSPDDVNEMKAAITVSALSVPACAGVGTHDSPTQASALLAGSFFNTASQVPGDQTNDVVAAVGIYRTSDSTDSAGTLRMTYFVVQCTDKRCDSSTPLLGPVDFPGTVAIGTPVNLEMQWDRLNHQFLFTKGGQTAVTFTYGVSDAESPGLAFRNLEVLNQVANCTAAQRPVANITALFDKVMLNQSAVPVP